MSSPYDLSSHGGLAGLARKETKGERRHSCLDAVANLIDDDSWAATFQSIGQYRTALRSAVLTMRNDRKIP